MNTLKDIQVLGDSVLKGIQVNPISKNYFIKNDIDTEMLSRKFSINIKNDSRFGCTVTKGEQILLRKLDNGLSCDAVVMDFGGNDCDYKWKEISEDPFKEHSPNTPSDLFIEEYRKIINILRGKGIVPILTNLPPIEPERFFNWWCGNLNKDNILKWLGSLSQIYAQQEKYSYFVEAIAEEEKVPLVDIRSVFLNYGHIEELICEDGTHPNSKGQELITEAFNNFIIDYRGKVLA